MTIGAKRGREKNKGIGSGEEEKERPGSEVKYTLADAQCSFSFEQWQSCNRIARLRKRISLIRIDADDTSYRTKSEFCLIKKENDPQDAGD